MTRISLSRYLMLDLKLTLNEIHSNGEKCIAVHLGVTVHEVSRLLACLQQQHLSSSPASEQCSHVVNWLSLLKVRYRDQSRTPWLHANKWFSTTLLRSCPGLLHSVQQAVMAVMARIWQWGTLWRCWNSGKRLNTVPNCLPEARPVT